MRLLIGEISKRARQLQDTSQWNDNPIEDQDRPQWRDTSHEESEWEKKEIPPAAKDPTPLPDNFNQDKSNRQEPIAQQLLRRGDNEGFVRIFEKSLTWFDHGAEDTHSFQGLTNHTTPGESWTLASSNWSHLRATSRKTGQELVRFMQFEIKYQDMIEEEGYRSLTGKVLRVLQNIHGVTMLHGESAVASQPMFQGARRGETVLWGIVDDEAQVILWDSLEEADKVWCGVREAHDFKQQMGCLDI
jgi:hypothetical protein